MIKNEVEKLAEKKQKLIFEKERLKDEHTINEANFDNKITKLKNKKYQEKQIFEARLNKIELALKKVKDQIILEKAFISGIDKD